MAQFDYLHDAKANTIGALLLHLAAIERLYQVHTFEGKKWGDWDAPAGLGAAARKSIKGNKLAYYLDILKEVREHSLAENRKRDDAWLMQVDPDSGWGPTNNYCKWFHVCEHESNHNGKIKWIKGRAAGVSHSRRALSFRIFPERCRPTSSHAMGKRDFGAGADNCRHTLGTS